MPYLLHDYQMTLFAPTNHPWMECEKTQINNRFESILDEDVPYSIVVKTIPKRQGIYMFKAFAVDFFVFLYIIYSICSIRKSLKQHFFTNSEAATGGALWKKMFLEISQNSQENTCARDFFNKVVGKTPFLQNTSGRMLLLIQKLGSNFR